MLPRWDAPLWIFMVPGVVCKERVILPVPSSFLGILCKVTTEFDWSLWSWDYVQEFSLEWLMGPAQFLVMWPYLLFPLLPAGSLNDSEALDKCPGWGFRICWASQCPSPSFSKCTCQLLSRLPESQRGRQKPTCSSFAFLLHWAWSGATSLGQLPPLSHSLDLMLLRGEGLH